MFLPILCDHIINMFPRLVLLVLIVITHYVFTNGYEKAIIQQVISDNIIKRPRESCTVSSALQCQGMPSGHVECVVIGMLLLSTAFPLSKALIVMVVVAVALQRVIFKWHTVLQTLVGGAFGALYAATYISSPMLYFFWLFPVVYVMVLVSIIERKLHRDPIPQWLSRDLYSIIWRKRDNISFLAKMIFLSVVSIHQTYTPYIGWSALEGFLDHIVEKFKNEKIDVVIGIKSGGAIISDYISYKLGIPNDYIKLASRCDKWSGYSIKEFLIKTVGKQRLKYGVCEDLTIDITGKRVLLVDEVIGSGQTMQASQAHLLEKGASQVFLATVECCLNQSEFPGFIAAPNQHFTVWPWGYDN